MKTPTLKLILAALAATTIAAAPAMADTACTVTVTKFHQSYPYSGRATVEYTVGGTLPANAVAEITITAGGASATFTQNNVVAGANTFTIDFASSFGGALLLTNASFVVTIAGDNLGGVQLWENGPYWAECNVGATKPEEYGYYFWWGDTVGYTNTGSAWISVKDGTEISFDDAGDAASTYDKDISTLRSDGYIETYNLTAVHDAATAHLGSPWRMPTDVEIESLVNNCTTTWTTTNGVSGRLVTGKEAYSNRSIFLPAAGYGYDLDIDSTGSLGRYWSSTPNSEKSNYAWCLYFNSSNNSSTNFRRGYYTRYYGHSVRAVRGFAGCSTSGSVTYDSSPYENWAAANGVAGVWYETDASGIHNVFRYVFGQPTGAITNPPLIDIAIEGGSAVVITPPVSNTVGFTVSVVESSDVAGATVTRRKPLDATGRTEFPMGSAASRFYRLSATEGDAEPDLGGVQLWENGPYWAECNVGATKPEEYGYYFWWGDTVGYTNTGSAWISVKDGTEIKFSSSDSTAASTYGKTNSELQDAGDIDATGNLVASHDAAHVHWGGAWRMPTADEIDALTNNCTSTWTTTNGVYGRLVTGKGDYANKSIFLPATGVGSGSSLAQTGSYGYGNYWSSTPDSRWSCSYAWDLHFYYNESSKVSRDYYSRSSGQSVRPVRGFAE